MNRDSLSCWAYGVLLAIVLAVIPFVDRFDHAIGKECPHGDYLQFHLPDLVSVNIEYLLHRHSDFISMEHLNLQFHAATVAVLLLIIFEVVKYKNYHVTFWSVLPALSFAFHPLRIVMLHDRCGLPFTASLFFVGIAVLTYLRLLFSVTVYGPVPVEISNTSSSIFTLAKMCLFVASLFIAVGLNRVTIVVPFIMLAYHLMVFPRVVSGAGLREDWRRYHHLSVACSLLAVVTYCYTRLPMLGSAKYFAVSVAQGVSSFSVNNEIIRCESDPDMGLCHSEVSSGTNTVLNMVCQSCLDIYKMIVLLLLPDVRNTSSGGNELSAMLLLQDVRESLDLLPMQNAWKICVVFFGGIVLLTFCFMRFLQQIFRNYICSSDSESSVRPGQVPCQHQNGFSAFCGLVRLMFVFCACVVYAHWHFITGLFPATVTNTDVGTEMLRTSHMIVRPGSTEVSMTAHLSYLSYFPSALLTVYLSVLISDVFTLSSGRRKSMSSAVFRASSGCDEGCKNPNCHTSMIKTSFWSYPMWLKLTLALLITHLIAICLQYLLILV